MLFKLIEYTIYTLASISVIGCTWFFLIAF